MGLLAFSVPGMDAAFQMDDTSFKARHPIVSSTTETMKNIKSYLLSITL